MMPDFSIGEISKLLGISASKIRNLEREAAIPKAKRNRSNLRVYSKADVQEIESWLQMARQ